MSIQGYIVPLSCHAYRTPDRCASCMGPSETQVEARTSEKRGNRNIGVTMAFPYCNGCAKRAKREKARLYLVLGLGALLGAGLALGAWGVDVGLGASARFAVALPLATALAALLALATRQSIPAPPATARGEAVILRDMSGTVLCTNLEFARLLARTNRTGEPVIGRQRMTIELWAPLVALAIGVCVLITWYQAGAPGAGL